MRQHRIAVALATLFLSSSQALAAEAVESPAEEEARDTLVDWGFTRGPLDGKLSSIATIAVPEGFAFGDAAATTKLLQETGNIPSGKEKGAVVDPSGTYFIIFDFDRIGYVKDDEKDALDKDGLLKTLRDGQRAANAERQKRGMDTLELVGWHTAPHYDPVTHNLEWGLNVKGSNGSQSVNYSIRLLGRHGVMSVELVADPSTFESALSAARAIVSSYEYNAGQDYASYVQGDKMAEYGLGALVAGGAVAAAAKSGLLTKAWKVIVGIVLAALAGLKKLFGGSKKSADPAPPWS